MLCTLFLYTLFSYGIIIVYIKVHSTLSSPLQSSSNDIQSIIESRVEKRTKGVYVPLGGRKMVTFMDDFNMPAKDQFGSQPPLELIRLWLDYGFWYNRTKQTMTYIKVGGATDTAIVIYLHWHTIATANMQSYYVIIFFWNVIYLLIIIHLV